MGFFCVAKPKRILLLIFSQLCQEKTNCTCLLILPAMQATCLQELHLQFIYHKVVFFCVLAESFIQSMVTYDDLSNNPALLSDPKLVIRINDRYILSLNKVSQPQAIPSAPQLFISLRPSFITGLKLRCHFFLFVWVGQHVCDYSGISHVNSKYGFPDVVISTLFFLGP